MPDRNTYLQYKRDTNRLIYWLIHTSNRLCQTATGDAPLPPAKVTAPQLSLSDILSLSRMIAARATPVPASIYGFFESAISARQQVYEFFQRIVTQKQEPDREESNRKHKAFIDMLVEAFKALGGETWKAKLGVSGRVVLDTEEDDAAFVNKYAYLGSKDDIAQDDEGVDEEGQGGTAKENIPFTRAKGRKGKKGKGKKKRSKQDVQPVPQPTFQDVPLESYRIMDEQSTVTDYLLAVYAILQEMMDLRSYLQGIWQKVAQGKLNSAAAGAMCNMAISIVKQLQFEIASDFPGNGSFDAILNTITRGDPDKAQGMFQLGLCKVDPNGVVESTQRVDIDVKECAMAHAYWDLLAFIQDFQKNRTGKPTKAMLARLNNWDPHIDLRYVSKTKRTEWRTVYTINWLYDLVVIWSSIILQRKNGVTTGKPQDFVLENVDWSAESKWGEPRRLWGPVEFTGDITTLAMCKDSADIKSRILPHHVFQMQCIVDSFTISRGWVYYPLKGHVFSRSSQHDVLQDIKHFQDRPNRGINYSIGLLLGILEREASLHHDPNKYKWQTEVLPLLQEDLNLSLGASRLAYGLNSLPPSRFSNTNKNGLWEYSPYLCGTGLADALGYIYNYSMLAWDRQPEPIAMLHLYNLLRQTGNISRPLDIYEQCITFFGDTVFDGGKKPTQNFLQSWKAACGLLDVMGWSMKRRSPRRTQIGTTGTNPNDFFSNTPKRIFKRRSLLALLKDTNWRPEKIADADLPALTILNSMRLMEKDKLPRNGYGSMSSLDGIDAELPLPNVNDVKIDRSGSTPRISEELAARLNAALDIPDDFTTGPSPGLWQGNSYGHHDPFQLNNRGFLRAIERDIIGDIYGNICPLSAISYLHLLAFFKMVFMAIEEDGQHIKAIREATQAGQKEPRVVLATWALMKQDPELLRFLGQKMTASARGAGGGEFSYFPRFVNVWGLEEDGSGTAQYGSDMELMPDEQCSIM